MRVPLGISAWLLGLSLTGSLAAAAGTADQAMALSDKAAAHMQAVGPAQAIKDFSDPTGPFIDQDLFVVVFSPEGITLASAGVPALVGHDNTGLKDVDGFAFGKALLAAPAGTWVNFKMVNPATKKIEKKSAYVNHVDGMTVFVGSYAH